VTGHLHSLPAEKLLLRRFNANPLLEWNASQAIPGRFFGGRQCISRVIVGFTIPCHKVVIFAAYSARNVNVRQDKKSIGSRTCVFMSALGKPVS
jgi:hypothetical protein